MAMFSAFQENFGLHLKRILQLHQSESQDKNFQNIEELGKHLLDDLIELSKTNAVDPEAYSLILKEIDLFQRTLDYYISLGRGDANQVGQEVACINKVFIELKQSIIDEMNVKKNELQKTAVISDSPDLSTNMDVYHSTSTGLNLENINSFLGGIKTNVAKGYGQGEAFYVWTTRKLALNHFEFIKNNIKGYPLLITIHANINPEEWDLDYELNERIIMTFIYNHFDLFKQIPDRAILIPGKGYLIPSLCKTKVRMGTQQIIVFNIEYEDKSKGSSTMARWVNNPDPEIDNTIGGGEFAGLVFNYMQKQFPQMTKAFENDFFKTNADRGTAIKYIGSKTLPIKRMEALVNNQWIDALELLRGQ